MGPRDKNPSMVNCRCPWMVRSVANSSAWHQPADVHFMANGVVVYKVGAATAHVRRGQLKTPATVWSTWWALEFGWRLGDETLGRELWDGGGDARGALRRPLIVRGAVWLSGRSKIGGSGGPIRSTEGGAITAPPIGGSRNGGPKVRVRWPSMLVGRPVLTGGGLSGSFTDEKGLGPGPGPTGAGRTTTKSGGLFNNRGNH